MTSAAAVRQEHSGLFGIVLLFDDDTNQKVLGLASETNSPGMGIRTERPHVSLYHADFSNLPSEVVESILKRIAAKVRGLNIEFQAVNLFPPPERDGAHFVFWDTDIPAELRAAHEVALEAAPYRIIGGTSTAAGIGLDLTERQIQNDADFGYIFAREDFRPHATAGWYQRHITAPEFSPPEPHTGRVVRVALYELTSHGRIVNEITGVEVGGRNADMAGNVDSSISFQ